MDFEDIFQLTDDELQTSFDAVCPPADTPPAGRAGPGALASEAALKAGYAIDGQMREYAKRLGLDVNLEPARFYDHVAKLAKKGVVIRDWMAAYQSWCRRAAEIHRERRAVGWE
jgi:hypothetical protein